MSLQRALNERGKDTTNSKQKNKIHCISRPHRLRNDVLNVKLNAYVKDYHWNKPEYT